MASNKTPNLNLDIWAEMDFFKRAELNANFNKLDTALQEKGEKIDALSKKTNWISIEETGAVDVAVSPAFDSTQSLKAAIAEAGANGVVFIPFGKTYNISDNITLSGTRIWSYGATLNFSLANSMKDGITINYNSVRTSEIQGVTLDMNNTGRDGIRIGGGDYPKLYDVHIKNSVRDGIHIEPNGSYSFIENFHFQNVKVSDAGRDSYRLELIAGQTTVFINVGNLINCEARGAGDGGYTFHAIVHSTTGSSAKISALNFIGGEFDSGNANSANDGMLFEIPSGDGTIEYVTWVGTTIENVAGSRTGYAINGLPIIYPMLVNVVRYNFPKMLNNSKNGFILGKDGLLRTDAKFVYVPSANQFLGSASASIAPVSKIVPIGMGTTTILTSTPTIQTGEEGQELILKAYGGASITLQDEAVLVGSNLKLFNSKITLTQDQTVLFRYINGYWRQQSPVTTSGATTVRTTTTSYNIARADSLILGDTTSGNITITLPTASTGLGIEYVAKKIDSSANIVYLKGNGTETIDGINIKSITTQYQSIRVKSDGVKWYVI